MSLATVEQLSVAIATDDFERVAGHVGQSRRWLLYAFHSATQIGAVRQVELTPDQVFASPRRGGYPRRP